MSRKNAAFEPGVYRDFTGYINFAETEGYAEHATFELLPEINLSMPVEWWRKKKLKTQTIALNDKDRMFTFEHVFWQSGIWHGGTWKYGTWEAGDWLGGTWHYGIWHVGTWNGGVWENGLWLDGDWHEGIWHLGIRYGTMGHGRTVNGIAGRGECDETNEPPIDLR